MSASYDHRELTTARNVLLEAARQVGLGIDRLGDDMEVSVRCAVAAGATRSALRRIQNADRRIMRRREQAATDGEAPEAANGSVS